MAQQVKNGGTFVNVAGSGIDWANPSNAQTSDNVRATAFLTDTNPNSDYLRATNFGFTIPSGATINGIIARIEKSTANVGATEHINDLSVKIVKGGTESGNEKADPTDWTSTDAYITYGSVSDLWGLSWTDSDINSSNFGISISATWSEDSGLSGSATARIDHIELTVDYTEVTGIKKIITKTLTFPF